VVVLARFEHGGRDVGGGWVAFFVEALAPVTDASLWTLEMGGVGRERWVRGRGGGGWFRGAKRRRFGDHSFRVSMRTFAREEAGDAVPRGLRLFGVALTPVADAVLCGITRGEGEGWSAGGTRILSVPEPKSAPLRGSVVISSIAGSEAHLCCG
jgi:hypothetical protein